MHKRPTPVEDIPVEEWPDGWLVLETASLLNMPEYVLMHEYGRRENDLPACKLDRIDYILEQRRIKC